MPQNALVSGINDSDFWAQEYVSKGSMTVEVQLLKYKFRFRRLTWREEYTLQIPVGKSQVRPVLIAALEEVSGLPVKTRDEATKIVNALPTPVASRVFRIYKGSLPPSRFFETAGVYRAPEPSIYVKRIAQTEDAVDEASDRVMQRMEQQFGKQELAEAAEVDQRILAGSKLRGAVRVNDARK